MENNAKKNCTLEFYYVLDVVVDDLIDFDIFFVLLGFYAEEEKKVKRYNYEITYELML